MAEISINGAKRTSFGKGASRRDRRAGLVPAVIYGHNAEPQHVSLPARELGTAQSQFLRIHSLESLSTSICSLFARVKKLLSKFQFTQKVLMTRMESLSMLITLSK